MKHYVVDYIPVYMEGEWARVEVKLENARAAVPVAIAEDHSCANTRIDFFFLTFLKREKYINFW